MMAVSTLGTSPQNFIEQMHFQDPITLKVYRCVLKGFQRFVAEQGDGERISRETIRQWLNDRILVWPFYLVAHRARLVDRFLDWLVSKGTLKSNPLAEPRTEYGQRSTTPVVRALLNADFSSALDALRPTPRFGSFLGPAMREHIAFMKALGYRYKVHEERMLRFDWYLQRRPDLTGQSLTVLIRECTREGSTAQHAYECHATGRSLSKVLSRLDPTVEHIAWDKRIGRGARRGYRQSIHVQLMSARAPVQTLTATEYETGVPGGNGV